MADEKSGDGTPKPSDRLKNLSPLQFRRTEPIRPFVDSAEQDRDRRAAEVKESAPGCLWRKILGVGLLGGGVVAGGFAGPIIEHPQIMPSAADSMINAIASGLASASKIAPPEMRAQAESVFRSALSAT